MADGTVVVDVTARLDAFDRGVAQAEKTAASGGAKAGASMAGGFKDALNKRLSGLGDTLGPLVGAAFALKTVDIFTKALADGIRSEKGIMETGAMVATGMLDGFRSIPVVGGVIGVLEAIRDRAFGIADEIKAGAEARMQMERVGAGIAEDARVEALHADTERLALQAEIDKSTTATARANAVAALAHFDLKKEEAALLQQIGSVEKSHNLERAEADLKRNMALRVEAIERARMRGHQEEHRRANREWVAEQQKEIDAAAAQAAKAAKAEEDRIEAVEDARKEAAREAEKNQKVMQSALEDATREAEAAADAQAKSLETMIAARVHEGATALGGFKFREGSDVGDVLGGVRDTASMAIEQRQLTALERVARATEALLLSAREGALA